MNIVHGYKKDLSLVPVAWVCLLLAAFTSCQMIPKEKPTLSIVELKGTDLQLKWAGARNYSEIKVAVDGQLEKDSAELELEGSTAWIHGILPDTSYTFKITGVDKKKGRVDLATQNFIIKEPKRTAGVLRPVDFDPPIEEKLGLITLLSLPKQADLKKTDGFEEARKVLDLVARRMIEIFIGDTFPIGGKDEIESIEETSRDLMSNGMQTIHGYRASSVLAVDLRLPDDVRSIPCQLSIRLLDISHPDNRYDKLWNLRPLIYEGFVEIEEFQPFEEDCYDQLIKALELGFRALCKDPVVREYQSLVSDPDQEYYLRKIEDCVGRRFDVSTAETDAEKASISDVKALALMFPECSEVYDVKPAEEESEEEAPAEQEDDASTETKETESVDDGSQEDGLREDQAVEDEQNEEGMESDNATESEEGLREDQGADKGEADDDSEGGGEMDDGKEPDNG